MNPEPFEMRYTNEGKVETVVFHSGFRTVEQFEAVRKIVESVVFDFSCDNNIFLPGWKDNKPAYQYEGPFCFLWYDLNEVLHLTRIGKRGKILKEIIA